MNSRNQPQTQPGGRGDGDRDQHSMHVGASCRAPTVPALGLINDRPIVVPGWVSHNAIATDLVMVSIRDRDRLTVFFVGSSQ